MQLSPGSFRGFSFAQHGIGTLTRSRHAALSQVSGPYTVATNLVRSIRHAPRSLRGAGMEKAMQIPMLKEARLNLMQALVEGGDVEFHYALAVLSLRRSVAGEGYYPDRPADEDLRSSSQAKEQFEQLEAAVVLCRTIPLNQVKGLGGLLRPLHERHECGEELIPVAEFMREHRKSVQAVAGVDQVRLYAQRLNDLERSPDGDDYNEILRLLKI